jgi:hypothetical protein
MSKQDSVDYGLEGFRSYIRNKIKYQREKLNFNEIQEEAAFYTDIKTICQEYYADLSLNDEEIIRKINCISNDTRDLIKKRQDALNLKLKESNYPVESEKPKALGNK